MLPETVRLAAKVMVTDAVTLIDAHADATSTVGILGLEGMVTASPTTGWPVVGAQLALLLQLLFAFPVQV